MVYGIRSKIVVHVLFTNIDPNDFVSDTPPVKKPNFGCQAPKKSCLVGDFSKPDEQIFFTANDGNSTITDGPSNFMDYGNDACMDFFSTGQYSRMKAIWAIRQFYVEM